MVALQLDLNPSGPRARSLRTELRRRSRAACYAMPSIGHSSEASGVKEGARGAFLFPMLALHGAPYSQERIYINESHLIHRSWFIEEPQSSSEPVGYWMKSSRLALRI